MTHLCTAPHPHTTAVAPRRAIWPALALACAPLLAQAAPGDEVVGRWKMVSHTSTYAGNTFDSHAALLQQRPCAAAIVYELRADKSYRLDASASTCDEKYKAIQEKLYSNTKWKVEGNKITTSATNFAVGQTYTLSVAGNRMTWVGTEGQGTMVFQK
ncbi:lipocalin family protein [Ideonella sp. A 288]|uniref:lipocalin family protein n=1 Tax=Ideonella sp. A 288 TaxID=1962181 RepID=UPI001303ED75|nr:lipocalin family protein [Ideonella sp. A 288]